jgi:hypothetical protein
LDLCAAVVACMVELVKLPGERRQQLPAFEVFDAGVKFDFDAAARGFPTDSTKDIRARHGPLLGKKSVRRNPCLCKTYNAGRHSSRSCRFKSFSPAVDAARAEL